jgi:hypothetical protein
LGEVFFTSAGLVLGVLVMILGAGTTVVVFEVFFAEGEATTVAELV